MRLSGDGAGGRSSARVARSAARRSAFIAAGAISLALLSGGACAPAAGAIAVQIVIGIATGVAVEAGSQYVEQVIGSDEPVDSPLVTVEYSEPDGDRVSASYRVIGVQKLVISHLEGGVSITRSGTCGWEFSVTPGGTARIEFEGEAGASVDCPDNPPPPPPSTAVSLAPFLARGEDGVPPSGTTMTVDAPDGELRVITSGPICAEGHCLPGGETRGSVVVLLPRAGPYQITNVLPRQNWLGYYIQFDGTEAEYQAVADDRVASMHRPGNCTAGAGCAAVDVLVLGPAGVIRSYQSIE